MGKKDDVARRSLAGLSIAAALLLQAQTAFADAAAKVYLPAVVQGETEVELRGGCQKWRNSAAIASVDSSPMSVTADVGYGFTP